MNEAAMYRKVLENITETEFIELWINVYPKKAEQAQHYWKEFSTLNFFNRDLFMQGRKRLNDLIWEKVEEMIKNKGN